MPKLPTTRQKSPAAPECLAQAFVSFTRTADSLENFYAQLQVEVSQLRQELERTNRDLSISLEENQRIRAYLGRILDALPVGVLLMDGAGSLRVLNPEGRRMLGMESEAGREQVPPISALRKLLPSGASSHGPATEQEWAIEGPDGMRYLGVSGSSLPTGEGSGQEFVYILRNITLEKQLRKEREAARRVQALAEMATLLAHEIRNPLGSLELFAGLLADSADIPSDARRWVDQLQAGLRALSATVNNVLAFHSLPAAELVPVDVLRLLTETGEFLAPLARQWEMSIEWIRQSEQARILAEPHSLRQVFLNLAMNAFRAMAPGGTLQLAVEAVRRRSDPIVRIEFQDQGKGILAEHLERIFEAGFTTTPGSPGLGLAVSKKIIEQHDGTITVQSVLGKGTTFTLKFPAVGGAG